MPFRWISDEPGEVEGHVFRAKGDDGTELEIPGDRITKVWTEDGDEVEGHAWRHGLEQEPDVEGHAIKYRRDDGSEAELDLSKVTKLAFTDEDGNEQEVEGHMARMR
jgi:hypothetical protein